MRGEDVGGSDHGSWAHVVTLSEQTLQTLRSQVRDRGEERWSITIMSHVLMSPPHKSSPAPARPAFQQWAMSPSHLSVSVMQWLLLIIYYLKDKDQRSRLRQIKAIVCLKLTHLLTTLFIYNLQPTCETWNNHTCIQESLWQSLRPFGARILSVLAEWIILCLVGRRQSYIKSKLQQGSNTLGLVGYSTTIHTHSALLSQF